MSRRIEAIVLVAYLAALALFAAGCGADEKSPSVASIGTTPSSNTSGSARTASHVFPPGLGGVGASMSTELGANGVRYTACMRSHGVPNFPDPDAHGTLTITISASLSPSSPLFQKAEADCQHLVPAGKPLTQARQQQMKRRLLAFAACMRSHGFPHYPDPTFGSGGMVSQGIGRSEGIDPSSPIFQAAQKACRAGGP